MEEWLSLLIVTVVTFVTCAHEEHSSSSSVSALLDFKCPEKFGYFPDPHDCTKYFVCVFGDPLHESCTGGLFFSADHQTCDWPRNTPCQQGSSSPTITLSSVNLDSISDHPSTLSDNGNGRDAILNSPATRSSTANRDLINDSSFGHVTSSSTSSLTREPSQVGSGENVHLSLNNNLRHSILTQSSSGPKYESSSSSTSSSSLSSSSPLTTSAKAPLTAAQATSSSSNIFYDEDIRDDQRIHNRKSNIKSNHNSNLHSNSPITDHSELVTSAQSTGSNLQGHHHVHRLYSGNEKNYSVFLPSSSSSSSSSRPPHPLAVTTTKTPVIFVAVGDDNSPSRELSHERKIQIVNLVPRRRPPKRTEVPFVPTPRPITVTSTIKTSIPVPVAITNQRNTLNRSPSSATSTSQSRTQYQQQFPFSFFSNVNQSNDTHEHSTASVDVLPVSRSANSPGRLIKSHLSPVSSTPPSTTTTTSTSEHRSVGHLFPEDGQPFGLLDYELSDTEESQGRESPLASTDDAAGKLLKGKPSILATLTAPPYSNSFESTSSINIDKSVNTRLRDELPSDASRSQQATISSNPSSFEIKCNASNCRLPNCNCGGSKTPNNLKVRDIPQIILLTFDDAVNDLNWDIYEQIFNSRRVNPNGCPILGTFYVSHEWTDYSQVQTLYSRGHEIASHGITHSFGEKFSKNQWLKEIDGQRQILNRYAGVKLEDVRGMRAPFLQIGGNKQFEMLHEANFTYDSSMPIFENDPPFYPYTLDFPGSHECMITPCPSKSFPRLWEVGLVMYQDLNGGRCSMADACQNPPDDESVFKMLLKNFNRHYKSNRAPFGLFYHSAWFNTQHHFKGFLKFIDHVLAKSDVYFTTNWQMIEWMKHPTTLDYIQSFGPWNCRNQHRPIGECLSPHVCNVKHKEGSRFMKTCQTCPLNYPWLGRLA